MCIEETCSATPLYLLSCDELNYYYYYYWPPKNKWSSISIVVYCVYSLYYIVHENLEKM